MSPFGSMSPFDDIGRLRKSPCSSIVVNMQKSMSLIMPRSFSRSPVRVCVSAIGPPLFRLCSWSETRQHLLVPLIKLSRKTLQHLDRKSTRLNSSHSQISYAVFCLKKKNTIQKVSAVVL